MCQNRVVIKCRRRNRGYKSSRPGNEERGDIRVSVSDIFCIFSIYETEEDYGLISGHICSCSCYQPCYRALWENRRDGIRVKKQASREFSVRDVTTNSDHTQEGRISRSMSDNLSHVKTICQQISEQNLKTCNNIKHV